MELILSVIQRAEFGGESSDTGFDAKVATTAKNVSGSVAVLPLMGTVCNRIGSMDEASGGVSTERFGQMFDEAMANDKIGAIVIDVNSPGGSVFGVTELSQKIFDARGQKPVVAVANSLMASAAFWIGSAADEIVATPSAEVGSVGVIAVHIDQEKALENNGLKATVVKSSKFKGEANSFESLSDEAHAQLQSQVDKIDDMFVADLARNRGVTAAEVRGGFGQGRTMLATEAMAAGLVDRIATMEQVIARLQGSSDANSRSRRRRHATHLQLTKP
jgi:signal peptide peptidase SppA